MAKSLIKMDYGAFGYKDGYQQVIDRQEMTVARKYEVDWQNAAYQKGLKMGWEDAAQGKPSAVATYIGNTIKAEENEEVPDITDEELGLLLYRAISKATPKRERKAIFKLIRTWYQVLTLAELNPRVSKKNRDWYLIMSGISNIWLKKHGIKLDEFSTPDTQQISAVIENVFSQIGTRAKVHEMHTGNEKFGFGTFVEDNLTKEQYKQAEKEIASELDISHANVRIHVIKGYPLKYISINRN